MIAFHHVNLGVRPENVEAEGDFLVEVLGYVRVAPEDRPAGVGTMWFRADDDSEVHLSIDPEHLPSAKGHVALAYGPGLDAVEERLRAAGIELRASERPGFPRVVTCHDPAGNLWELRGQ